MPKIQYWYESQLEQGYVDITGQVSVHARGGESINDLPGSFSFSLEPYKKDGAGLTVLSDIDINIGDKFLITEDLVNVIACGIVNDPGRDMLKFDRVLNQAICRFDIVCIQQDFSTTPIDSLEFTQTLLSEILDEIMLYTDESLGHPDFGKYKVSFSDYVIDVGFEKKTAREAITEICEQIECFWAMRYTISYDATYVFIVKRFIEIITKSGSPPPENSTWQIEGITNTTVKNGFVTNPIEENRARLPVVAGETDYKIQTDTSVMINYLDISCKIYEYDNNAKLTRYDHPAEPGKFDYELNGYADDIPFIAHLVNTTVLASSTSSSVRVPSRNAANGIIQIGDKAYFKDSAYNELIADNFYAVTGVNVVNTTYTEIAFSPSLPFTPATGSTFEIGSNITVYRTESEVNYASKGALIDCDKKNHAKVKFTDLAEPPPGATISFFYVKVKDHSLKLKNDESIQLHGLKYKEIKIDDDTILTLAELTNVAPTLLILKPAYQFLTTSRRYGIAFIGMSLSVLIDNLIRETFILTENEWEISGGYDYNKRGIIAQTMTFSTEIKNPERSLQRLRRLKKKTATSANTDDISIQIEKIKCSENIVWTITDKNAPATPTNLFSEGIVQTAYGYQFTVTWDDEPGVATNWRVHVEDADGNYISGYNNLNVINNVVLVNGSSITATGPYYVTVKAVNANLFNASSEFSAPLEVSILSGSIIAKYPFDSDFTDSIGSYDATGALGANVSGGVANIPANIDFITLPGDLNNDNGQITISFWFKLSELNSRNIILCPRNSTGTDMYMYKYNSGAETITIYGAGFENIPGHEVPADIDLDTWYFMAVRFTDPATGTLASQLYFQGEWMAEYPYPFGGTAIDTFRFGWWNGASDNMHGSIDTIRVHTGYLDSSQLQTLESLGRES